MCISDRDGSAAQIGHQSDLHFPGDLIGHCSTDRQSLFHYYPDKIATVHAPTHVARRYQPVIRVIVVKAGFLVS